MLPDAWRPLRSPALLLVGTALAVAVGAAPWWILLPCAAWVGAVGAGAWWRYRNDPRGWVGAVARGRHPGCCAVIVDVRPGDAPAARVLLSALAERGVPCAVFVAPGLAPGIPAVGTLLPDGAAADGYWRPLGARPGRVTGGVLVAHTVALGVESSDDDARVVVATDLVRLDPRLPPGRALGWVQEWVGRAVVPAALDEVLGAGAAGPPRPG
mgnify:CR=1 FL=1